MTAIRAEKAIEDGDLRSGFGAHPEPCRRVCVPVSEMPGGRLAASIVKPMGSAVGLFWQQAPLSTGAIARFLVPEPLPKRPSYVEPLRRRVRFGGVWIADSEHVLLLFEPGRYPAADFPESDISPHALERTDHTTQHHDLRLTCWYWRGGEPSA